MSTCACMLRKVGGGLCFVRKVGIFFSFISLRFPSESWDISRNFFAQTKTSSLLRCGKYEFKPQFAAFSYKSVLSCWDCLSARRRRRKLSVFSLKITKRGLKWVRVACDFKGSGGAPASRQRDRGYFRKFLSPGKVGIFLKIFPET